MLGRFGLLPKMYVTYLSLAWWWIRWTLSITNLYFFFFLWSLMLSLLLFAGENTDSPELLELPVPTRSSPYTSFSFQVWWVFPFPPRGSDLAHFNLSFTFGSSFIWFWFGRKNHSLYRENVPLSSWFSALLCLHSRLPVTSLGHTMPTSSYFWSLLLNVEWADCLVMG